MRDEHRLRTLKVCISRHDGVIGGFGEGYQCGKPLLKAMQRGVNTVAHEEAHVGGDLLVTAAAGVQLERESTNLFGQLELDEVVDVFGLWGGGNDGRAELLLGGLVVDLAAGGGDAVGPVDGAFANASEALQRDFEFFRREDSGGCDGLRMGLAGGHLLRKEAPVEGEAALPLLEGAVEGLAEAAGPHFCGLLLVAQKFLNRSANLASKEPRLFLYVAAIKLGHLRALA